MEDRREKGSYLIHWNSGMGLFQQRWQNQPWTGKDKKTKVGGDVEKTVGWGCRDRLQDLLFDGFTC